MPEKSTTPPSLLLQRYASILGASGVAIGALGAHALKDALKKKPHLLENWRTAVIYQLFHATALLGISSLAAVSDGNRGKNSDTAQIKNYVRAGQFMTIGSVFFSGSIYLLCLGIGPKPILGPSTPFGGMMMIGGWILLGIGG